MLEVFFFILWMMFYQFLNVKLFIRFTWTLSDSQMTATLSHCSLQWDRRLRAYSHRCTSMHPGEIYFI